MAEMVRQKVASGAYATESEVIRDGLHALQARDAALDTWLHDEVAASYDEHEAHPQAAMPAEMVMEHLRVRHRARLAKPGG